MNSIILGITNAIKALQFFLVRLIIAIKHLSNIIIELVLMGLKILFYVAPFALMFIIGISKHWWWMTISGGFILILILVFSLAKGIPEGKANNIKSINRFFGIITFILSTYSIFYFGLDISVEKELINLIKKDNVNSNANKVREYQYLKIIEDTIPYNIDLYIEAIQELGKLKSEKAVKPIINKLQQIDLQSSILDDQAQKLIIAYIEALSSIKDSSACKQLIIIEITALNIEIKLKAKKAADNICK